MNIDKAKIRQAARANIPLTIKTFTLPPETEAQLEQVLAIFLEELGQTQLKDQLAYCLRELAVNAKKANTKRVYFIEKGLDINNPGDYNQGMESFKSDTLGNINYYLGKQKDAGYYIKVTFQIQDNKLYLAIKNNALMTQKEQMRVYDRIARSRAYSSLEDALTSVVDDSEGAGLGIIILILMLQKLGLNEESFDINVNSKETISQIIIPTNDIHMDAIQAITDKITAEVDSLPQFPENIASLQRKLDNPDSEMAEIARDIATDVSLSADLLKLVNSAAYMTSSKVKNIPDAVKLVGIRGIKNLLYSYGTQKILKMDRPETKGLWEHSYQTAFYAYTLAKSLLKRRDIIDDAYVGGILHDMGKIVFASVEPGLMKSIGEIVKSKGVDGAVFEQMSAGLNHTKVGSMIAQKWNFPEVLIHAIEYHHSPHDAPKDSKPAVFTVYLANCFSNYEDGGIIFEQVDPRVLQFFKITTGEQFKKIHERLLSTFKRSVATMV